MTRSWAHEQPRRRSGRSSVALLVGVLVGCGPQVVLDFEDTGDDAGSGDDDAVSSMTGTGGGSGMTMMTAATSVATMTTIDPQTTGADDGGGPAVCGHQCFRDADCHYLGQDIGLICENGLCTFADKCTSEFDCIAEWSGWTFSPCTPGGGECMFAGGVCIDLGDGTGGCATPSEGRCTNFGNVPLEVIALDDGNVVVVCAYPATCQPQGNCISACGEAHECGPYLTCDASTGECVCLTDQDCVALDWSYDLCHEGRCYQSCTDPIGCEPLFDGGAMTCAPA